MSRRTFHYPKEFVLLPDYSAHRGQQVTVVRPLTRQEYDFEGEAMFLIRADDGWEGHAWRTELQDKCWVSPPEESK